MARQTSLPLLDQVEAALVVLERDGLDVELLALVDLHLEHEDVLVEVVLKLLVREVDAELLEGVDLEALEPEDVQHTDAGVLMSGC